MASSPMSRPGGKSTPLRSPSSPKSTPTMSTQFGTPKLNYSGGGGGGGGGSSSPQSTPTSSTIITPPQSVQIVQSTPTNQAQVRAQLSSVTRTSRFAPEEDRGFQTRVKTPDRFSGSTAEEEFRQMSLPEPRQSFLGNLIFGERGPTRAEYEREQYFENLIQQKQQFSSLPEVYGVPMSTPQGSILSFTYDSREAQAFASKQFESLPYTKQREMINTEALIGVDRAAVGAVASTIDFGKGILKAGFSGMIQEGEKVSLLPKIDYGKTLQGWKEVNPFIGQLYDREIGAGGQTVQKVFGVTIAGISIASSLKSPFGKVGTSSDVVDLTALSRNLKGSLARFSPIKVKPGVFTRVSGFDDEVTALSVLQKKGNTEIRTIYGVNQQYDDVFTISRQESKLLGGGQVSFGPVRQFKFQKATGISKSGDITEGFILSKVEGVVGSPFNLGSVKRTTSLGKFNLEGLDGGISNVIVKPQYSFFLEGSSIKNALTSPKGFGTIFTGDKGILLKRGGISKGLDDTLTYFATGKRTPIPRSRIAYDVVIREPSGAYKLDLNVKGVEVNLNALGDKFSNRIFTTGTAGSSSTGLVSPRLDLKSLQLRTVQSSLLSTPVQVPKLISNTGSNIKLFLIPPKSGSQQGQITIPSIQSNIPKQSSLSKSMGIVGTSNILSLLQPTKFASQQVFFPETRLSSPSRTKEITSLSLSQSMGLKQLARQKMILKTVQPFPKTFNYSFFDFTSITPPFFFKLPKLLLPESSKGRKKAMRGYVETPSLYGALGYEFGFKQPKGRTKLDIEFGNPFKERPFKRIKLPKLL